MRARLKIHNILLAPEMKMLSFLTPFLLPGLTRYFDNHLTPNSSPNHPPSLTREVITLKVFSLSHALTYFYERRTFWHLFSATLLVREASSTETLGCVRTCVRAFRVKGLRGCVFCARVCTSVVPGFLRLHPDTRIEGTSGARGLEQAHVPCLDRVCSQCIWQRYCIAPLTPSGLSRQHRLQTRVTGLQTLNLRGYPLTNRKLAWVALHASIVTRE